jgi:uridine kinase
MGSRFVAIVGGSGSGKSWVADRLADRLKGLAGRLSLDDFYRDLRGAPAEAVARVNFDHPEAIDWDLFHAVLDDLEAGRRSTRPQYDFATHSRTGSGAVCEPLPLVLVDGLWLLSDRTTGRFARSVFLDCPPALRLKRRLERDQRERGRSEESVRRQFSIEVTPMHEAHVEPQKAAADITLVSPPAEDALEALENELADLCKPVMPNERR